MTKTVSTPEITPISPEQISRVSDAYGDANSTLVARVRALRSVIVAGHTVKGLHAAMLTAHISDPSIDVQSTTTYGFAAAAAELAGSIPGVPFSKISSADLALFARAAKHVKVGAFKAAARNVLGNMGDDAGPDDALIALRDAFTLALSVTRADHAKAAEKVRAENERAARNAGGTGGSDDDESSDDVAPVTARAPKATTESDVLASIHAATKYLQDGAEWSADLASAIAQLADAASTARKRTRVIVAA